MSEPTSGNGEVRPDVVAAISAVLQGADPAELPAGATREEKAAAKDQLPVGVPGRARQARPPGAGLGAAADPQLRRAPDVAADLRRPRPPRCHDRTGHALRRPAGRRAGGVRAPVRGTLGRLSLDPAEPR